MKKIALLTLTIFLTFQSRACYNEYNTINSSGRTSSVHRTDLWFRANFDNADLKRNLLGHLIQLKSKSANFKTLSDYALLLVQAGKPKEALQIFLALRKKYPKEYTIAANLGTTYELLGENKKALFFIKKGIRLNPKSHEGSEWVHVKLLEVKIELEKNKQLLTDRTLLELTEDQLEDRRVLRQIQYQLEERIPFCKAPDETVATLLIDLGDCYRELWSYEHAKALYEVALYEYHSKNTLLPKRIRECLRMRKRNIHQYPKNPSVGMEIVPNVVSKVDSVDYKRLLFFHDNSGKDIRWENLETDPQTLLEYIGLNQPNHPKATGLEEAVFSSRRILIGLTILGVLVILGLLIQSKRTSNNQ